MIPLVLLLPLGATAADSPRKTLPLDGEVFEVSGRTAFLVPARADPYAAAKPWVWYAPTLPNLPGPEERWMFEKFRAAGVAVAGVDAGESYGSPAGNKVFDAFHDAMTGRGYSAKPVLLGRSRGGLMTLSWAAANPHGFRAALWHQGESDANQKDPTRTLPGKLYREYLEKLIRDSRKDVGWDAPWFVARVSYHVPGDETSPDIRAARASLWKDKVALEGPDSDALKGDLRENGGKGGHFSGLGLRTYAAKWVEKVSPWLESQFEFPLVGYTELRTNLPGGRHANVRTMRAAVVTVGGTGRRLVGEELSREPDTWTQFAGWSPDGKTAIIGVGWQSPENAKWEEENKRFRMDEGRWRLDSCLLDLTSGKVTNVTAIDRVSHYNGGLFFLPDGKGLGFTPLIKGVSKPFVMDPDGRNKRDVSGTGGGFAYGYSASPDGRHLCYHENYQLYVSDADGSNKKPIKTGHPFDFAPKWSPDGTWLLFVSGEHYDCHPHLVRSDGTGLKKLADRNGYRGVIEFLDVFDFHAGSSDVPVWSIDGASVYFTARVGTNVELFQTTLDGKATQLTKSVEGSLHYHPQPSPDGRLLVYGSLRDGARNLYVMNLADRTETRLTDLKPGTGAMWPHWQPAGAKPK
jgi:TolB protein